jgi:hypothetical protein
MRKLYTTLFALILLGGLLACMTLALLYQATGEDRVFKNSQSADAIEVGDVVWGRDFDGALAAAKKSGKPVFALFQEVPG